MYFKISEKKYSENKSTCSKKHLNTNTSLACISIS